MFYSRAILTWHWSTNDNSQLWQFIGWQLILLPGWLEKPENNEKTRLIISLLFNEKNFNIFFLETKHFFEHNGIKIFTHLGVTHIQEQLVYIYSSVQIFTSLKITLKYVGCFIWVFVSLGCFRVRQKFSTQYVRRYRLFQILTNVFGRKTFSFFWNYISSKAFEELLQYTTN